MAMDAHDIESMIKAAIPDADGNDPRSGRRRRPLRRDRDFGILPRQVARPAAPDRLQSLKGQMGGVLHALALQTGVPEG